MKNIEKLLLPGAECHCAADLADPKRNQGTDSDPMGDFGGFLSESWSY